MRSAFAIAATLLVVNNARADAWYEYVRYVCNPKADLVQARYLGTYDDSEATKLRESPNTWNPWTLVNGDGRYIRKTQKIQRTCKLSDGLYVVSLSAVPCNSDIQGRSGAMMMVRASITHQGRSASQLFGACEIAGVVVTSLTVQPRKAPVVERKKAEDYFQ